MSIINRLFRSNMVDCPRCLGKGNVDTEDIKRLKKELIWAPGKCAYCNGNGKVPPDRIEKIGADAAYLTTDLPSWERHKLITGDPEALQRADEFKAGFQAFISEVEHLYYIKTFELSEIADHFFHKNGQFVYSDAEKQEFVAYLETVIKSKLTR